MVHDYFFHNTCYDSELLREEIFCLDENSINYHLDTREDKRHARAPLSGHFEVDISIHQNDYDKASTLLSEVITKHTGHMMH